MRILRIVVAAAALSLLASPALTYADGSPACKDKCKQSEQCKDKCKDAEQCKDKCKDAEKCKEKHANGGCKQDAAKCPKKDQK